MLNTLNGAATAVREPDYWSVGKTRFATLEEVGKAAQSGQIDINDSVQVDRVGWDLQSAQTLKTAANVTSLATLATAGLTVGLAALAPAVPGGVLALGLVASL